MAKNKQGGNFRDAKDGKFAKKADALKKPNEHVFERAKPKKKK